MITSLFSFIIQQFTRLRRKQNLIQIIRQNQEFLPVQGVTYGRSNHISMAIITLYRMNYNSQILKQYMSNEISELIPIKQEDKQITITEQNILNFSNNTGYENFPQIVDFYKKLIQHKGLQYSLNFLLDNFGYNWVNHIFHTIIRLQFALDINDKDEIAHSMAYYAVKSYEIPQYYQQNQMQTMNFDDQILHFQNKIGEKLSLGLKYQDYYEQQLFQENYKKINFSGTDEEFKKIGKQLLLLYLKSFFIYKDENLTNFICLHLVTGFYAFRNVYKYYQKNVKNADLQKMVDGYFLGFFSNYCNLKCPNLSLKIDDFYNIKSESQQMEAIYQEFKNIDKTQIPQWEQLFEQTTQSLETHTIKIIYVCSQEAQFQPELDFLYRLASYYRIKDFTIQ